MEINLNWLQRYVALPKLAELSQLLNDAGIEVEEVYDPRTGRSGVVVSKIIACTPHPKADRLQLCTVDDGSNQFTVVCGAPNARAGLLVPFARLGAQLLDLEIVPRKIRGVDSEGMLCGKEELGLEDKSAGLWELPESLTLGDDIFEATDVSPTLTLGITPNRPDLLSHFGVAREVSAATGNTLHRPEVHVAERGAEVETFVHVDLLAIEGCSLYAARVLDGVKVGPSPAWLVHALERIGQRSINNVVDVTNYVMFELGHPTHAFDLDKLAGDTGAKTLVVRRAHVEEKFKALDGTALVLTEDDLVIADDTGPVALAGVMGGALSQVSEETTRLVIESAYFEPTGVRRTSKKYGLHTESSHRFERGADYDNVIRAVDRVAQLLLQVAGGEVASGQCKVGDTVRPAIPIKFRLVQIQRLLGISLGVQEVVSLLEPLGIRSIHQQEDTLMFEVPSCRVDLLREVDLIEEVARRYGYDNIPICLPGGGAMVSQGTLKSSTIRSQARDSLLAAGLDEIVTYGFDGAEQAAMFIDKGKDPVVIVNPLGSEMSRMRTSLVPGLLRVLSHNLRHAQSGPGANTVRLFEIGETFTTCDRGVNEDSRDRYLPEERLCATLLIHGERDSGRWYGAGDALDFSDMKGAVELLAEHLALRESLTWLPAARDGLNPHCAAVLELAGEVVGWVGQIHPQLLGSYSITTSVYCAELDLARLGLAGPREVRFSTVPKFPSMKRDLALVVDKSVTVATFLEFIQAHAGGSLGEHVVEDVTLFDRYLGAQVAAGKVSLAFAISYRHGERTLTEHEINSAFSDLQIAITKRFLVEIR